MVKQSRETIEIISSKEDYDYEKEVVIGEIQGQHIVRIPRPLSRRLNIKTGDKFVFMIHISVDKATMKPDLEGAILEFKIRRKNGA